jgi:site-specific DNA-methyltransferase (adenine-specific)
MALAQDYWPLAPESAARIGHPAPFPVALAERLIRFYAYPRAHVLDPFAGSGTVGVAALRLGCRATLVDIDASYCELAKRRCERELSSR